MRWHFGAAYLCAWVVLGCGGELGGGPSDAGSAPDAGGSWGTCVPFTSSPELLASGLAGPSGIAADALNVYVGEGQISTQRLDAISKADGAISSLGWGGGEYGLRDDADFIYWVSYVSLPSAPPTNSGVVSRVSKGDGGTTILAQGTLGEHEDGRWTNVAIDDNTVYWLDTGTLLYDYVDGRVMRVPKAGGSATAIATDQDFLIDIGVDAEFVYWSDANGVARAPKTGGSATTLATFASVKGVVIGSDALAVDDSHVYFSDGTNIRRVSTTDHGVPEVLYSAGDVTALTIDPNCVYFATTKAVLQMPKSGWTPKQVAALAPGAEVWRLAADDEGLYYSDYSGGTVSWIKR